MVKILVIVTAVLVPIFGEEWQLLRSRAVARGDEATIDKFPFYAAVHLRDGPFRCGATIISYRWVLTAAHCLRGISDPKQLTVHVGSDKLGEGKVHAIIEILVHPYYSYNKAPMFDYALMELATRLKFGKRVSAIELGRSEDIRTGTRATVVGHGVNGTRASNEPSSRQLMQGLLIVDKTEDCFKSYNPQLKNDTYPMVMEHVVCSTSYRPNYQYVCVGDSGGPLVINGRLAGVTSAGPLGPGCRRLHSGQPGELYALSVPAVASWIQYFVAGLRKDTAT